MPVGGGAVKIFLRVKQSDHSVFIPATTATTSTAEEAATAISAPTVADAALVLKNNKSENAFVETSGFKYDDSGVGTVSYGHTKMDEEILAFQEIACPKEATAGGGDVEEITAEDGTKGGGATASGGAVYLCIDLGPAASDGKLLTNMCILSVKKSSGSTDYKKGAFVRPTLECTQVECNKTGNFAIPQTAFDDEIWGTIDAAKRTIKKGAYVKTAFLPKAA